MPKLWRKVTYVLRDCPQFGLEDGYCILGLDIASGMDWTEVKQGKRQLHALKCWPEFYDAIERRDKTFELRRDDRRPRFAVGDILEIVRYQPEGWSGIVCQTIGGCVPVRLERREREDRP